MFRDPFWRTTRDLLRYRKTLAVALGAAVFYALGFGAGLAMIVPIIALTFNRDTTAGSHPLAAFVQGRVDDGQLSAAAGERILAWVPEDPWLAFVYVLLGIGVISLLANVARYLHTYLTITVVQHLALDYRGRIFRQILDVPLERYQHTDAADTASRIMIDTSMLARGHEAILGKTIMELFKAIAAMSVAFWLNWKLAMVFIVVAVIIGVGLSKIGRIIRRASKRALKQQGAILKAITSTLQSLPVIKAHNAGGYERRRFKALSRTYYQQEMTMRRAKAFASPMTEWLGYVGVAGAAALAGYWVFREGLPAEIVSGVLATLGAAAGSFKPLSGLHNQIKAADAAAARVLEALDEPVEPLRLEERSKYPTLAQHRESVVFEGVHFAYASRPDEAALVGIDLRVEHGQTVAIVGTNGAGKSTLVSLLPRLILPTRGRVLIDGTDIAGVNLRSLREQIAVVSQHSVLFEGTIAENIAYARPGASRERIEAAAVAGHADGFIRAMADGYDQRLGEGGSGLSGGQKQRLCIARAVLRDPAILILDEATSQVDAESEAKIAEAIKAARAGRTTFVIAHRLSTVIDSDRIVVMDAGAVLDVGTHDELLQRCALYQSLTHHQLRPPAA